MNYLDLVRIYADAFIRVETDPKRVLDCVSELQKIEIHLLRTGVVKNYFECPSISFEKKKGMLRSVFNVEIVSDSVQRLCLVMLENGRLFLISQLKEELERLALERQGTVKAVFTVAEPLDAKELERIRKVVEKKVQKQIIVEIEEDPEILGGVIVKIGNLVIDGSVRNRLDRFKQNSSVKEIDAFG